MNHSENLLVVASEECAEIQKEIAKALRFGTDNHHPDEPEKTNGERIIAEFHQLRAVMDMLVIQGILPAMTDSEISAIYRDKVEAVEKWEQYSKHICRVE